MTSSSIQSGNNGSKTRRFSASFKVGITADTRGMPSELTGDTTLFTMSETRLIAESPLDECSLQSIDRERFRSARVFRKSRVTYQTR
jgi:hypothetical protein